MKVTCYSAVCVSLFLLFGASSVAYADNPLVRHIYTADPAPVVYDGRFYVFTGHDEGGEGWTLRGWHVLSSEDMVHWTDHGEVLSCEDISWLNPNQAWASQCVVHNGKFYFYICDSGEIGVAVADNILGPYTDALGHPLITNRTPGACPDNDNIDPAVFIDDDGQAYIYWGTDGVVRQAKLKSSMIELDGEITVPQGLSRFFEASWVHKKDGIYYYSYAAHNDDGQAWPSNIDYATSTNPLGPWTYIGTLNGFAGTGTNHSGIVEYEQQWYFVYHTDYLSDGTPWARSVQIDYLVYNDDNSLQRIRQTTEGVEPLKESPVKEDAYYKIQVKHSGKLMEIEDASLDNLGNVQQAADNGEYSQQWAFDEVENGVYAIINRNSGLALDADLSNDNVIQYDYWGGDNQKWKLTGTGDGTFYIVNKEANRVLDVYYAETADGTNIQHWGHNGETCQMWEIVEVDENVTGNNASEKDGFFDRSENESEFYSTNAAIKKNKLIVFGAPKQSTEVTLYNLKGIALFTKVVCGYAEISLKNDIPHGSFILQLVYLDGKKISREKVFVK